MVHINFNCKCGIELILAFKEHEFEYSCPRCGIKIIRFFNPIIDDYAIRTEEPK